MMTTRGETGQKTWDSQKDSLSLTKTLEDSVGLGVKEAVEILGAEALVEDHLTVRVRFVMKRHHSHILLITQMVAKKDPENAVKSRMKPRSLFRALHSRKIGTTNVDKVTYRKKIPGIRMKTRETGRTIDEIGMKMEGNLWSTVVKMWKVIRAKWMR
jgi:hypothetical protein